MLLDYLSLIYGGTQALTLTAGIPSAEAFGTPSLHVSAGDVGNPSPQTTISGGNVARPIFGSSRAPVTGTGRNKVR
jgi:hypothetical protein